MDPMGVGSRTGKLHPFEQTDSTFFRGRGFNVYFGNAKQINPRKNGNNRNHISGQIIATSHDRFPPNGGLVRESPLFQGNLAW